MTITNESNNINIGIFAHVDCGKTTLSECLLYNTGSIRRMGRVDNQDAYLDNYEIEKKRGITVFSKQARFSTKNRRITLLDTPGHVDFQGEMERTLSVIDYAILVLTAATPIQPHTETLIDLFTKYEIPFFVFVNKMDQGDFQKNDIISALYSRFKLNFVDFTEADKNAMYENIATSDEALMEEYLESGIILDSAITSLIFDRKLIPVIYGSALNNYGVMELIDILDNYTTIFEYPSDFGARVYKISRDESGHRLTFLKVTGGYVKNRECLINDEKINQIRLYSGEKYTTVNEIHAGEICAVTGIVSSYAGQGIGYMTDLSEPVLKPVLSYNIILPKGISERDFMPKLNSIAEEEPLLDVSFVEKTSEIIISVMGEIQLQILHNQILERFNVNVSFGEGKIIYRETISEKSYGVGHFEPLRHYAEVHLFLEPLSSGDGIIVDSALSFDILDKNYQKQILSILSNEIHHGVLTNSPLTDVKITLVNGRSHRKHTEGGDFREATKRALRNALMKGNSKLLEPFLDFMITIPSGMLGRILNDLDQLKCDFSYEAEGDNFIIKGIGPVSKLRNYSMELTAYTKGLGRIVTKFAGYYEAKDPDSVISGFNYDAELDQFDNPGSIFCEHGSGEFIPWYMVEEKMHMPSRFNEMLGIEISADTEIPDLVRFRKETYDYYSIGIDEVDEIIDRTFNKNRKPDPLRRKRPVTVYKPKPVKVVKLPEYLLVDGYNIIHAWEELSVHIKDNMCGARDILIDIMSNYQAMKGFNLIIVFDAYKVPGNAELMQINNINVVYTKNAQTADQYIERFTHENSAKYDITVATSDGLEQIIIRGAGAKLLSARDLKYDVDLVMKDLRSTYLSED